MQLVAYGAQDIYLTGNPQITFFKVVYRRHTNFAMECVEQTLSGSVGNGASVTATVSRNGDLVGKMYVTSSTANITAGDSIVEQVDVEIGGQRIDRHYKEWLQVWAELSTPDSKALGYKNMTGALSHGLSPVGMVQIPLQFWFNRNPGLALPLIALQYHEVKIKIVLGTATGTAGVKLWADYIYLDTDERRRFAQVSHEYLIEQLQRETASVSTSQKLNFNHPVKELVWTSGAVNTYGTAKLQLNGHDRFAAQEEEYFQLRQPIDHHTAVPGVNIPMNDRPVMLATPIIVSSGAAAAVSSDPSGDNTFRVLAAATQNLKLFSTDASDIDIKLGDVLLISYATGVGLDVSINCVVDAINAAPADGQVAVYTVSFTAGMGTSDNPIASVAGAGSITVVARVQDSVSRCSNLNKKINVYSFALKPEEHQPSGTCNFSRIDNARLITNANLASTDNIYAVNYNVLRVMSGMGGLAYSN
jgi:hypothetical protein